MKNDVLNAVQELIEQYETDSWTGRFDSCPMCVVTHDNCEDCLQNVFDPSRLTERTVISCADRLTYPDNSSEEAALHFWKKAYDFLKDQPEERFEDSDFTELIEIDKEVYEESEK